MTLIRIVAVFLIVLICPALGTADERQELLEIKNTTLNLIEALVEEGLLSKEKAEALIKKAEAKAAKEASHEASTGAAAAAAAATGAAAGVTNGAEVAKVAKDKDVIRVPYVPEFVRDEIREQVRAELKEDVLADVKETAKSEKWGTPDALPEWVSRFRLFGDMRVRGRADLYGPDNIPNSYLDFNAVNAAGGIIPAGQAAFLNTTIDRYRAAIRARLGMEVTLADDFHAIFRMTTGNIRNPVSTNQSLGNYAGRFEIGLDWAYLNYDLFDSDGYEWLNLQAGRFPNPWFYTDLVWDDDLSFEGLVAKFRADLRADGALEELNSRGQNFFLTAGIFPLQETAFEFTNKWIFGAQTGLDWTFDNLSNFTFGVAYYHYANVQGIRNTFNSTAEDGTAPLYVQKGNNMFDIRNDNNPDTQLFALASKFHIFNVNGQFDYAGFAPIHVILTADYARNFGFDPTEVYNRTGIHFRRRVNAWQARLLVGRPRLRRWADWHMYIAYKYLERDSVLDAFTDSNFHFGGTDAKGFVLGARLGLTKNTSLHGRWFSANQIDGPPLGIDVLLLDLDTVF